MKIGYFGSPDISFRLLKSILEAGDHEVVFVVSNPDKPRGRSGKSLPTPVSEIALEREIPLYRFESLRDQSCADLLRSHGADLFFIFAYGKILPEEIFKIPPLGSVNLHASILPLLRGASPIQSAILNGFSETGWTLQFLAKEMDAGDIIALKTVSIDPDENTEELTEKMLPVGIELSLDVLNSFQNAASSATPQDHSNATYCKKLRADGANIDWKNSAREIHDFVRALSPWPVARTTFNGHEFKIHRTAVWRNNEKAVEDIENLLKDNTPGRLLVLVEGKKKRVIAGTGNGFLEILELQPANRKKVSASDFINGYRIDNSSFFV